MTPALPVVTVHFGDHAHVVACLRVTLRYNREVVLIGDASNAHYGREIEGVRWIGVETLPVSPLARELREQFVNYSTNPRTYELNCFLRMFYVRALLDVLDAEACFHIDSDCALLTDISRYRFDKPDALVLHNDFDNPIRMTVSVHSARLTRAFLDAFMQTCMDVFVSGTRFEEVVPKIRYHQERRLPGGVCDMTLYHMTARGMDVQDLGTPRDGAVFDHRFGFPEGNDLAEQYEMAEGHKRVTRRGDAFYLHDVRGSEVRLLSIHFQGIAKRFVGLLNASEV